MKNQALTFFYLIYYSSIISSQSDVKFCLQSLSNFVKSAANSVYQVILMSDNDPGNSILINDVTREIMPTRALLTSTAARGPRRSLRDSLGPSASYPDSLFVVLSSDPSFVEAVLDALNEAGWPVHHPYILLISRGRAIRNVLERTWTKRFADVTLLQISANRSRGLLPSSGALATIRRYDPFARRHDVVERPGVHDWFPDKMRNMNGYPLRVDVMDNPPLCRIERNATGHVLRVEGAEGTINWLIAERLNLTLHFYPRNQTAATKMFESVDFTELSENLKAGRVDMIANSLPHRKYPEREEKYFTLSISIMESPICPIVPIITIKESKVDYNFLITLVAIAVIIFIIRIVGKFGQLDQRLWSTVDIVRLILGFTSVGQPKRLVGRIMFVSVVVFSIIYSGSIFDQLTSMELRADKAVPFNNRWEILENNLTPQGNLNIFLKNEIAIEDRNMVPKKLKIEDWGSRRCCIYQLIEYKNVTCLESLYVSRAMKIYVTKRMRRKVLKIMKDCLWSIKYRYGFTKGSPFLEKYNKILLELRESGIVKSWIDQDFFELVLKFGPDTEDNNLIEGIAEIHMKLQFLLAILASGYSIAIIALALECLVNYWFCH